jgi:xanthine dehydrogenase YagR molybdenum-binding subunit
MATANWPAAEKRSLIGKRHDRIDGLYKTTGVAKYSYDINRPNMLWAKVLGSPHARAKVVAIDTGPAEKVRGVRAAWKDTALIGQEVAYAGQIVAAIAADTEEIATEAVNLINVTYEKLPHQVVDNDPSLSTGNPAKREQGKVDDAFKEAGVTVVSGEYGIPVITHCCLEPHGQVSEVKGDELFVWPSTQNVSGYANRLGEEVGVAQNKIRVETQHMGGGFGSKFNYDKWGVIGSLLAKQAGRPVKLMLERDMELAIAGNRPSDYAKIKVAAKKDGTLTAIDAEIWGTGGSGGFNPAPMPYVFTKIPNQRSIGKGIRTNRGGQRAWRAPNHPQGCYLTMSALADTAAALKMDELEFFMQNLQFTDRPQVYADEMKIAAQMIGYAKKSHPRGDKTPGHIKRGLGMSIHTWGGRGHPSECDVTINPDGSVEAKLGSQDLGVGNRTTIAIVVAETLGLQIWEVDVKIGRNDYPASGGSGGSTTVGGVSTSSRKASTNALNALLDVAAKKLGVPAAKLEAADGKIRQTDKPANALAWKDACKLLGTQSITKRGANVPNDAEKEGFISAGVGGCQMADVSVDIETGIVTMNEMVAVQDVGLVISLKTCESQVYGALIMGITSALFEEAVYDTKTGRMLNADMEFYRLAGLTDVGKLKVHMMTGPDYDKRGVIGVGEPPAVSPCAAIANAVANAIGVRVPYLPLTPDRVIAALQKGGMLS